MVKSAVLQYAWPWVRRQESRQARDLPWLRNPGQTSPEVKNRGSVTLQKGLMASKKINKINILYLIISSVNFILPNSFIYDQQFIYFI